MPIAPSPGRQHAEAVRLGRFWGTENRMRKIFLATAATLLLVSRAPAAFAQEAGTLWPQEPSAVFGIPLGGVLKDEEVRDCEQPHDASKQDKVSACAPRKGSSGRGMLLSEFPLDTPAEGFMERRDSVEKSLLVTTWHAHYQDVKSVLI